MLSIAPASYRSISPAAYLLPPPHLSCGLSLSLSCCMWIDELLLCWMSGCLTEDTPAAGGTPGDKRWLHVPHLHQHDGRGGWVCVSVSLYVCVWWEETIDSPQSLSLCNSGAGQVKVTGESAQAQCIHSTDSVFMCVNKGHSWHEYNEPDTLQIFSQADIRSYCTLKVSLHVCVHSQEHQWECLQHSYYRTKIIL